MLVRVVSVYLGVTMQYVFLLSENIQMEKLSLGYYIKINIGRRPILNFPYFQRYILSTTTATAKR